MEGDLHNFIGSQLKAHSVPGAHLVLQLPESKIYTHLRPLQAFQKIVASFGCRLCLEQFGTSLNSFQMLGALRPGACSRSTAASSPTWPRTPKTRRRSASSSAEARKLGKQTIAEFVSDASSMTVLFSIGVDLVQGNFLAPPGPAMNYDFG